MKLPTDLPHAGQNILAELSFSLVDSYDGGMNKWYEWTNELMRFRLLNGREYFECEIVPYQRPIERLNLIRLLRFLKNDKDFYKEELIEANLWYTLPANDYIELFYKNYDLIKNFIIDFNQEKYDSYYSFEFSFDGL